MEARFCLGRILVLVKILAATALLDGTRLNANEPRAGNLRTRNFVVTAPDQQLASQIGFAAEKYRSELAREWLGKELPDWPEPCVITAYLKPQAFGETSFSFTGRPGEASQPFDFVMQVNGSRERILDSVLPHEISHTIFATHFKQPLPRWADEGACTTVEHLSERRKNHQMLIDFLTTGRGIPFNRMFAMKNYPRDILPLYAQGYSLCRFLIQRGGKRKFVQFMNDGLNRKHWKSAIKTHYGIEDLSQLQVQWLAWVKQGCPRPETGGIVNTRNAKGTGGQNQVAAFSAESAAQGQTGSPRSSNSETTEPDFRLTGDPSGDKDPQENFYLQEIQRIKSTTVLR